MTLIPGWNTSTVVSDDVGMSYEIFYDYPVNNGMSIKAKLYITSHNESGFTN